MSWISYALLGMTIWSAAAVADRALLLRMKSMRFYLVIPTLLQLILASLLIPFMPPISLGATTLIALASGVAEALVLYFLYVAVSKEEVSRVFSLTGLGPIMTLVFGWLFLGEIISSTQLIAFALFFIGGLILSVQWKSGTSSVSLSKSLVPIFVGSLISSLFFILLRHAFVSSDFWTGFYLSRIGFFATGVVIQFLFRTEIQREWSQLSSLLRVAVIGNQVLSFLGHCFYFLALSLASAALVQSLLSVQSGIILLMALLVARFDVRLLDEKFSRRDIVQKVIGITLTALATYLLTIS